MPYFLLWLLAFLAATTDGHFWPAVGVTAVLVVIGTFLFGPKS